MIRGNGYITEGFDTKHVNKIIKSFKNCIDNNIWGEFDTIACLGTSGLIIAPILSLKFKKKLLVVRKERDNSHAYTSRIEGHDDSKQYIIIDDFVCTGSTLLNAVDTIEDGFNKWCVNPPIYKGCYLWNESYNGHCNEKQKIMLSKYKKLAHNKTFARRTNDKLNNYYAIDKYEEPELNKDII